MPSCPHTRRMAHAGGRGAAVTPSPGVSQLRVLRVPQLSEKARGTLLFVVMALTLHLDTFGNSCNQLPFKYMCPVWGTHKADGFMVFKDYVRLLGASFFLERN